MDCTDFAEIQSRMGIDWGKKAPGLATRSDLQAIWGLERRY